jgi:hypothetical protein
VEQARTCAGCGGELVAGSLASKDSYYMVAASQWLEGPPEKSIWSGLRTQGRLLLPVAAYCCQSCGKLELYARPPGKS